MFGLDKLCKKETLRLLVSLYLSLVYGSIVSLVALFKIVQLRGKFFQVKRRDVQPNCLLDPTLGKHEIVQLKKVKLHYVAAGHRDKPLLLFIHGFPEFWFSWRHQIREFSKDYFVVAPDLRGYGESEKPEGAENYTVNLIIEDIKELIESLNKDKCILVGHDWGGAVAWSMAISYPNTVDKLIILNAPHLIAFRETLAKSWKQFFMSWYFHFFNIPLLPELFILSNDLELFNRIFKSYDGRSICSDEELEAYKYTFSRPNALTCPINFYRATVRGYQPKRLSNNHQVTVPTLIIWGLNDAFLSEQLAELSQKYCNNVVLKRIENCSHWTQQDKPEVVNSYMRDFLR